MTQTPSEPETLMQQAWPPKSLEGMGPKQKKLLGELSGRQESWKLDGLRNLLLMVKHDFPEDLVDISRSWDQPKKASNP